MVGRVRETGLPALYKGRAVLFNSGAKRLPRSGCGSEDQIAEAGIKGLLSKIYINLNPMSSHIVNDRRGYGETQEP